MILNKDINPEYNLYYVGSRALEVLIALNNESSFDILYNTFYKKYKVTVNLFLLALDWLYIVEAISLNEQNLINVNKQSLVNLGKQSATNFDIQGSTSLDE